MTHSYNNHMPASVHPRLDNLLASLSLNLAEEGQHMISNAPFIGVRGRRAARRR